MRLNFEKYYQFPLTKCSKTGLRVYTSNNFLAFDFAFPAFKMNSYYLSEKEKNELVNYLNGRLLKLSWKDVKFYKKGLAIFMKDKNGVENELLRIRNLGGLISKGTYNLNTSKAYEIQNEFLDFILRKLINNDGSLVVKIEKIRIA